MSVFSVSIDHSGGRFVLKTTHHGGHRPSAWILEVPRDRKLGSGDTRSMKGSKRGLDVVERKICADIIPPEKPQGASKASSATHPILHEMTIAVCLHY